MILILMHLRICRHTKNDPVMGGQSYSKVEIQNAVLNFTGACKIVPSLKAPGFITVQNVDNNPWPDIRSCKGLEIRSRSYTSYKGFRISFGNAHAPGGSFFAYGYKAGFSPPTKEFGSFKVPFSNFTDFCELTNAGLCSLVVPSLKSRPTFMRTQGTVRPVCQSTRAKRIQSTALMTKHYPTSRPLPSGARGLRVTSTWRSKLSLGTAAVSDQWHAQLALELTMKPCHGVAGAHRMGKRAYRASAHVYGRLYPAILMLFASDQALLVALFCCYRDTKS